MKKLLALLIFMVICISIITPSKVHAVDITAGITSWIVGAHTAEQRLNQGDYKIDNDNPQLLIGPALAVKLNEDYNLTFVYLTGKIDYHDKNIQEHFKSKRNDADIALNYRLNNYFKVFIGMKYLSFDMMPIVNSDGIDFYENYGRHTSMGPGLGLSATFPMTENLFLLATLSGFYLFDMNEKIRNQTNGESSPIPYREQGFNSTLSLAYYISSISTVISLGGRWQYFTTNYKDKFSGIKVSNSFAGITLTATYTFSI